MAMLLVFMSQSKVLFRAGCAYSLNAIRNRQIEPPSRPAMLYGRDDLVAELTKHVINNEHLALIGPGGMGKSSVAKAIINEPLVADKFADRRFLRLTMAWILRPSLLKLS
jgi:hypothetical protein